MTLTLKANPVAFSHSPPEILRFFPNINTMVVQSLTDYKETGTLPDTVTALVVEKLDFIRLADEHLRYADRVVEVRGFQTHSKCHNNFALFQNLERLTLFPDVPPLCSFDVANITLPTHKLKTLHVRFGQWKIDPFALFPLGCAGQIVVVHHSWKDFVEAKAKKSQANAHIFCCEVGEGVSPEDLSPWRSWGKVTLSDAFGVDELRAFNERFILPFRSVAMNLDPTPPIFDLSFLKGSPVSSSTIFRTARSPSRRVLFVSTLAVPTE